MCADLFSFLFPIQYWKLCEILFYKQKKNIYISNRFRWSEIFSCTTGQNDFVFLSKLNGTNQMANFGEHLRIIVRNIYRDSWHDFLLGIVFRLMNALSCYFRSRYVAVESIRSNKQARTNVWTSPSHRECTLAKSLMHADLQRLSLSLEKVSNGGYGGILYKITPVLKISSIEYYIRLIRFVREKYRYS